MLHLPISISGTSVGCTKIRRRSVARGDTMISKFSVPQLASGRGLCDIDITISQKNVTQKN